MNYGKSKVGENRLYHAGAVGGLDIDENGVGTIVQSDGTTYAQTVTLPKEVVSLFKCEGMDSTCSQVRRHPKTKLTREGGGSPKWQLYSFNLCRRLDNMFIV